MLLWHVAGEIGGDGLFHLARVRKLEAFDSLSLEAVDEFVDGGLHPGYAFPLWHGFLALVARVAFLDPSEVVLHEASVLAPLALLVAYEAGYALFRRVGPAVAVVCAQVGVTALAPAHGGAYTALGLPATASRQLLVPAAIALAFAYVERPSRRVLASVAAAGLVLAVVHPTYAIFLWVPFAGFLAVRSLVGARGVEMDCGCVGRACAAGGRILRLAAPGRSRHRVARAREGRAPSCVHPVRGPARRLLGHELPDRAGGVRPGGGDRNRGTPLRPARRARAPPPLGRVRPRRLPRGRGGDARLAALRAASPISSRSRSHAVRAGFWPLSFAFAGGFVVLAALLRGLVLPLALAAGIVLQLAYPGEFDYALHQGGPALVTWIAVVGGVVALVLGLWLRPAIELPGGVVGLAAGLFVLPMAVHAAANWSPSEARRPSPLTSGLVAALREDVPEGAVVYSDLETSYRIAAEAPVYIAAAPPGHVADTEENRPYKRREENIRFFRTGNLEIPRRAGAEWLVVDRRRFDVVPQLDSVYRDSRYTLYVFP